MNIAKMKKKVSEVFNQGTYEYFFTDTVSIAMTAIKVEAFFILRFVLWNWDQGGWGGLMDKRKDGQGCLQSNLNFFPIVSRCPDCFKSIMIGEPFMNNARKLSCIYFSQYRFEYVKDTDTPPTLDEIISVLESGEIAGCFDYECPECGCKLIYQTPTSEAVTMCGEQSGMLVTQELTTDELKALQNSGGYIILNNKRVGKISFEYL